MTSTFENQSSGSKSESGSSQSLAKEPSRIRILEDNVINQIAAGEVVERPSSVAKELIENAIDAGASKIQVLMEEGGHSLLEVSDNGRGMTPEELKLAVKRHATSKLRQTSDLQKIHTLGFRGEALPSIEAVSRFTLTSSPHPNRKEDKTGAVYESEGGRNPKFRKWTGQGGTRVLVEDLFFNVPARLKFLKKPVTEQTRVIQVIKEFACCYPKIEFVCDKVDPKFQKKKRLLEYKKSSSNLERSLTVMEWTGLEEEEDFLVAKNKAYGLELWALLLKAPSGSSNSKRKQQIFINGRIIKDRMIYQAVLQGYRSFQMDHEVPAYVLHLKCPGDIVDVNVHPTKAEVRFSDSSLIFGWIKETIQRSLESGFRKAHRAPEHFLNFTKDKNSSHQQSLGLQTDFSKAPPTFHSDQTLSKSFEKESPRNSEKKAERPLQAQPIASSDKSTQKEPYYSSLNVIGVLWNTYILCQNKDEFVLIDQHAAHERVTYNKLKKQHLETGIQRKSLLMPETVQLQEELLSKAEPKAYADALLKAGYLVDVFGEDALILREIPSLLEGQDYMRPLQEALKAFEGSNQDIREKLSAHVENLIATMACYGSVRAGQKLEDIQIKALLDSLDRFEHAPNCPHGRPAAIRLGHKDMDRLFKRTM
jgi:DNA mismatch repair protein MutL